MRYGDVALALQYLSHSPPFSRCAVIADASPPLQGKQNPYLHTALQKNRLFPLADMTVTSQETHTTIARPSVPPIFANSGKCTISSC